MKRWRRWRSFSQLSVVVLRLVSVLHLQNSSVRMMMWSRLAGFVYTSPASFSALHLQLMKPHIVYGSHFREREKERKNGEILESFFTP